MEEEDDDLTIEGLKCFDSDSDAPSDGGAPISASSAGSAAPSDEPSEDDASDGGGGPRRRHPSQEEIVIDGDRPRLRDQSLNGCRVDGAIVNRCEVALQDGSEVEFGPRRDCPSIRSLANAGDGHTPCRECRPHAKPRGEFVYRVHALRSNKRARQVSVEPGSVLPLTLAPAPALALALGLPLA